MRRTLQHDSSAVAGLRLATMALCGAAGVFTITGCATAMRVPDATVRTDTARPDQPAMEIVPDAGDAAGAIAWSDQLEPAIDAARPWTELTAIWFYYRRAELTDSEAGRIAGVVRYAAQHPAAEIGITRPADMSGAEPVSQDVNRQRVAVIRDALIRAGISPLRIHAVAFKGPAVTLNRLVFVSVRDGP